MSKEWQPEIPDDPKKRLDYVRNRAFRDAIQGALLQNNALRHYLATVGVLFNHHKDTAKSYVNQLFEGSDSMNPESPAYHEIMRLAIYTRLAVTITAGDWKMTRVKEASEALSLKSIGALQDALWEQYGDSSSGERFLHLHKGPGNGILMNHLGQPYDIDDPDNTLGYSFYSEEWEQFGVGREICLDVESVLRRFVRSDKQNDPAVQGFVQIISDVALRRGLKEEWYEKVEGTAIEAWEPKVDFFDLNHIFKLLADPAHLLHKLQRSKESAKYVQDREFEQEARDRIQDDVYRLILRYEGSPSPERIKVILREEEKSLGKQIHQLSMLRKKASRSFYEYMGSHDPDEEPDRLEMIAAEIQDQFFLITGKRPGLNNFMPGKFKQTIKGFRKAAEDQLGEVKYFLYTKKDKQKEDYQERLARLMEAILGPPQSPFEFLREIFTDEFVQGVEHYELYDDFQPGKTTYPSSGEMALDLNLHPEAFVNNMAIGFFTDIPKYFPEKSAMLITGVRSDSHEDDDTFTEDVAGNLRTLAPGGVLKIDGLRQSFSRVYRLKAVQKALKSQPDASDFRVYVDFDERHSLGSLFIQRAHPERGYLTEDRKTEVFEEGIYFSTLEDAMRNPRIALVNWARNRIRGLTDNPKIFYHLREAINNETKRLLTEEVVARTMRQYKAKTVEELLPIFGVGSVEELKKMLYQEIKGPGGAEILDRDAIVGLRLKLGEALRSKVVKSTRSDDEISLRSFTNFLTVMDAGRVYTFPRTELPPLKTNKEHVSSAKDGMVDNAAFLALDEDLEYRTQRARQLFTRLTRKTGNPHPLLVFSFTDCVTNRFLEVALQDILDPRAYAARAQVLPVTFGPDGLVNTDQVVDVFGHFLENGGGLLVGGGSWTSVTEAASVTLTQAIGDTLIQAFSDGEMPLGGIGICWWSQWLAQQIARLHSCEDQIYVRPGMLEIGNTEHYWRAPGSGTTQVLHPIARDFPSRFTLAMTHADHIVYPANGMPTDVLTPLAHSATTGLPVIFSGLNDRLKLIQAHPELRLAAKPTDGKNLPPDVAMVHEQLITEYAQVLKSRFGAYPKLMERNWLQGNLKADAGRHLLVRTLEHQLQSVVDQAV